LAEPVPDPKGNISLILILPLNAAFSSSSSSSSSSFASSCSLISDETDIARRILFIKNDFRANRARIETRTPNFMIIKDAIGII
jgi:hypothetical protein